MEYTISAYHDKRNGISLQQGTAESAQSGNVQQPHSVSYDGVFETGADGYNDEGSTGQKWGYTYACADNSDATGCFGVDKFYNTRTTETNPYMFANWNKDESPGGGNVIRPTSASKKLPEVRSL